MPGWTSEKRELVETSFFKFLNRCYVNSKDYGLICIGENLWEGQYRVISQIFDALEEDIHDIYVLKARQLGMCYAPSMRVLTADLRWVRIEDLKLGDEIVAVDEMHGGRRFPRKMRTAHVEAIREVFEPAFKLRMSNGVELIATAQHRHLCKVRGAVHTEWRTVGKTKVGDSLRCITEPWGESYYEDGWYGGLLDGEGSLSLPTRSGAMVGISQIPGAVLDRAKRYLEQRGFSYREEIDRRKPGKTSKFGTKDVHKLVSTKMSDLFRLFGLTRPSRFISKRWWEGKELPGKKSGYGWHQVESIEVLGSQRMIDLQTSEKTFICEGFVSHNSTIFRCLTVFLIGYFRGIKGAIVFDTAENKNQAREELETIIADLPKALKFPGIKKSNREGLILTSNSQVLFKSAGIKKSKSSGTLGRSVGLSICHASEMCSWDNDEGLQAFRESLSDINENRLYLWESTARGFNMWYNMWGDARKDTTHCKCIFIGWWGKDSQRIERDHPDFDVYGTTPPSEKEAEKIRIVRDRYGVEISVEQLAWIRRKMDPTAQAEGDADPEFEGSTTKIQEQPWIEEEAFQQTGAIFFSAEKLTEVTHRDVSPKFNSYFYSVGAEFIDTHVIKAPNAKMAELKVWEEPDPDGYYVIGCDPAFGENENNDRSSIQVARCYADGLDQVAEYASPLVRTEQLAWVLASLMGWYGGGTNAQVKYGLELNGPGAAVFTELRSLKHQVESHSYLDNQLQERGLKDIFRNVKTYLYTRVDAIQGGFNYQIKTTAALKITLMERLRDNVSNGKFRVRSMELVEEMKTIAREGDTIKAPGSMKDDRVLAASFVVHVWENGPRKLLMASGRTREAEAARQRLTIVDQVNLFQANQLQYFFARKNRVRVDAQRELMRRNWRGR